MTITILPPALTQFFNGSGVPLAGGSVYMYQPNSTTFKTTWQDPGATIPNSNPIILNGAGEAAIWGSGEYLQVVYDSSGNEQYSALTLDPGYAIIATFNGTSTTSVAIGTGSKSFTTQTGLQFFPGGYVTIANSANALDYMNGIVTSYNTATGALVVNVLTDGGSGTFSSWNIGISGVQGPAGTVTSISIASANGFAGTSTGGGTPQLTLSTTVTGVLKGNGTAISAATSGTDYIAPNSGSGVVNETMLDLSNVTAANVTTSAHGFVPILPNNALQYLNGIGTYTTPALQALIGTSTTSNAIGLGSLTFTTQSNLALAAGQFLVIVNSANSADYVFGQVTSYSSTTLVINVTSSGGSGTFTNWNILASGPQGAAGTGTINPGTIGQFGYYAGSGTALSGLGLASGDIFVGNGSGVPAAVAMSGDATLSNTGAITFDTVNSNVGSYTNTSITVNAKGLITAANSGVAGGFINKFRNGTFDIWQRGTSGSITTGNTAYTADGWIVGATGATVSWLQSTNNIAGTYYQLNLTGNTGMTDTFIKQRIESYIAQQLINPFNVPADVTVQFIIYNNTGSSITPTLTVKHCTAQDNWGATVTDISAVSLQACPYQAFTTVAYTFTPSVAGYLGLEITVDFGAAINANTKDIIIGQADIHYTPGVPGGLNNSPPLAELRPIAAELPFNQRYLCSSYGNSIAPGTATHAGMVAAATGTSAFAFNGTVNFPVQMRATPTLSYWDGAGNSSKVSATESASSFTFTDNVSATPTPGNISVSGFMVGSSGTVGEIFIHYLSSAEL